MWFCVGLVVSKRCWNLLIEKMLHRLSIKPSTEKFFRNEQALSTYIENTIQSYGAIPLSTISNLGHNTSKISNQRSRLGGNISKVSVRSCDSKLSNAPQPNHNNYELGYKIARNRRSEKDSPFTCCYRGRLCNIRINREKISEENPKSAKNEGGTYLKLQTHLLEQRQKKQYY